MSGANRAKVVLSIIAFERSNVLVLDEPTNHLDYKAKEALDLALRQYEGTIIMVSHDRYLLNSVPTKIIEMKPDSVVIYKGNYEYYKANQQLDIIEEKAQIKSVESKNEYTETKKNKAEDRKRRAKLMNVEKEMTSLQAELDNLKELCNDPEISSNYTKLSEILEEIKIKENQLEELETLWLELA